MSISTVDRPQVFKNVKEAPSIVLFLIFVSEIGLNWLYVNFFYDAFSVPASHTDGLIQPLFVLSFLKCAFIILGVAFWIGKFGAKHLCMTGEKLKIGLISTFFFWSVLQIILILVSSVTERGIVFHSISSGPQPLFIVGTFLIFCLFKSLVRRSDLPKPRPASISHKNSPLRQIPPQSYAGNWNWSIAAIVPDHPVAPTEYY